jgi:DnaK suppressor protein
MMRTGGFSMSNHLTAGQRAALQARLELRRNELDRRIAQRQEGLSRAEHASEVLKQDADDAPQRDADREIDLALTDQDMAELGAVSRALRRVHDADFGLCIDCGSPIPFDRLQVEPQTLRCVDCARRIAA